mgnify:CR=1 FL=1
MKSFAHPLSGDTHTAVEDFQGDPVALRILTALIKNMLRSGALLPDDIEAMCDDLDEDAAHELNCILLDLSTPSQSDYEAEFRRKQMRLRTEYINRKRDDDGA